MLLAIEGAAGAGKTTLRNRLIEAGADAGMVISHVGQFSWLSLCATRTLVELRAGRPPADEDAAVSAIHRDLTLHATHNLAAGRSGGHIIADRLVLSSGCLLALYYDSPVESYLQRLATVRAARPEVTFVLDTPTDVCARRLAARSTGRRATEQPEITRHLAALYIRAADAWAELSGGAVWRHPAAEHADTDLLVSEALELLRAGHKMTGCRASGRTS
jgi:thymidylate kinase